MHIKNDLDVIHESQQPKKTHRVQSAMLGARTKRTGKPMNLAATLPALRSEASESSSIHKPRGLANAQTIPAQGSTAYTTGSQPGPASVQFLPSGQRTTTGPNGSSGIAGLDQISPELAAQIVKNYILPMFESDGKRALKSKYNRMQGIASAGKPKFKLQPNADGSQTVYGELKLSEKLFAELDVIRDEVNGLKEQLEESTYQRDVLTTKVDELHQELHEKQKQIEDQKGQIMHMRLHHHQTLVKCEQIIRSSQALTDFVGVSERYRKRFSENLREALSLNDLQTNQIYELHQNKRLSDIQYQLAESKLNLMFDSVNAISNAKNLEDKYQFELNQLGQNFKALQYEKGDLELTLNQTIKEKDNYRQELKEMVDLKQKIEKEKQFMANSLKAANAKLDAQVKELEEKLVNETNEKLKLEKALKASIDEREKMKLRIVKLKNRKGKVDQGIKMCRNCGKEFHEKENFNWSCRTHPYDYSGEMWWCCGKRGKEQPGCKFSKHECKEDDDEDEDEAENEKNKAKHMKYIRCQCCKEVGHSIDKCPLDPNFKTVQISGVEAEQARLAKLKDYKKLFADT